MPHRSLTTLVLAGLSPTTAATVLSILGDEGLPNEVRVIANLMYQPWQGARSGLLVMGMDPTTDITKVSTLIQDRTTWWDVAVALSESIKSYEPALLAQGAIKVIPHPEDDLYGCRDEIRHLLSILSAHGTDLLGLELSDLIQLYGEKRVPKTIRIAGDGVIGSIFMREGSIVHADTMDEDDGMSAFTRMFAVRSPELRVHNGCLTQKSSLNLPAMTALLEGARVNDEGSRTGSSAADSSDTASALDDILSELDFGSSAEVKRMSSTLDDDFDH